MSRARWERLVGSLAAAGIAATVCERSYPGGVSRSITMRHPQGGVVVVNDESWSKNLDVWLGWTVYREGPDGICVGRPSQPSRKRSVVVAAVADALAPAAASDAEGTSR